MNVVIPLLEELGGWPTLESSPGGKWNVSNFDLTLLLTSLYELQYTPLINFYIDKDPKVADTYIINVSFTDYYSQAYWKSVHVLYFLF